MIQSSRLVGVTIPIDPSFSPQEFILYCARVSNPNNQETNTPAGNRKLASYLIKNKHWSPFEMVSATIEIKTTRDIARQILRHRSFSFQEFSQRYAEVVEFADNREARLQDTKNRQNSVYTDNPELKEWWDEQQEGVKNKTSEIYKDALNNGIAKEVARSILPEGLSATTMYMSGTLRSWLHYIHLRSGNGTQKEHVEVARLCNGCLMEVFPDIMKAVEEYGV